MKRVGDPKSQNKVICLHGGPGMDASYFLPYLQSPFQTYELIVYTQGEKAHSHDIDSLVLELDNIVNQFKGDRIFLLGHSFGGALALEYMAKYGKKIAGLILCAWVHSHTWSKVYSELAPKIDETPLLKNQDEVSSEDEKCLLEFLFYKDLYFTKRFHDEGERVLRHVKYNAKLREAIVSSYMGAFDCERTLRETTVPVLAIAGGQDRVVFPKHTREIRKIFPKAHYLEFDRVGHFPFIEDPERFNSVVNNFITAAGGRV